MSSYSEMNFRPEISKHIAWQLWSAYRGYSHHGFYRAIGISQPTFSRIKRGEQDIKLQALIRACHAVGLDPATLLAEVALLVVREEP